MSQAEQAVLACIFIDNQLAHKATSLGLREEHFGSISDKQVWRTVQALAKDSIPIDAISVAAHLESRGALDSAGSYEGVNNIELVFPDVNSFTSYVDAIKSLSLRRKIGDAGQTITRLIKSSLSTEELLQEYNALSAGLAGWGDGAVHITTAEVAIDSLVDRLDSDTPNEGIKTGYFGLDGLFGGLRPGNVMVIAGRPGMGKTSLALNMMHMQATKYGQAAGFFSLEMSSEELIIRILSAETGIPVSKLRVGALSDSEWYAVRKSQRTIQGFPMYFEDSGGLNSDQLAAKARELRNTKGIDILYVDYIQLMQSGRHSGNRTEEVSQISRDLKKLAKELHIPIVALSQLNRMVESRPDKRPQLADLRESGSIEQDADIVMFVFRSGVYETVDTTGGETEFIVAKNRSGPSGMVKTTWHASTNQFLNPLNPPGS